jgi:hypothetical protein
MCYMVGITYPQDPLRLPHPPGLHSALGAECSRMRPNEDECSLNEAECSLNEAECSPGPAQGVGVPDLPGEGSSFGASLL